MWHMHMSMSMSMSKSALAGATEGKSGRVREGAGRRVHLQHVAIATLGGER